MKHSTENEGEPTQLNSKINTCYRKKTQSYTAYFEVIMRILK